MEPISVIMMVHNEAETIGPVVREYHDKILSRLPGSEFIIAEDGSNDGTKEILKALAREIPLRLEMGEERRGYANAFRRALGLPRNEIIFLSDSGGKHDPEDFWKLYGRIGGADLVIGVKTDRRDSAFRKLMTWGYNRAVNLYFGSRFRDIDSGFRLIRKSALRKALSVPWIFPELISSEVSLRLFASGARIEQVPVSYRQRIGPSRGLPLKKIPKAIWQVLRLFPALKKEISAKQ
ncbi:MAG TPA: glycosyltransferase family 2 protein [Candidatus Omnitrophota bacterium]|nr:glycosyltransferase family 2 protein [Candidatus Omnitrophota bacterium]